MKRQGRIAIAALVSALMLGGACNARSKAVVPEPKRNSQIGYINPQTPKITLPAYGGARYTANVPDTLDLAEMARLSVHGLTSCVDPDSDYEVYWRVMMHGNRPVMYRDYNHQVQVQMQEALPLMRLISGSRKNMEVEQRWNEVLLQMQGPDGLLYYPAKGRPWIKLEKDSGMQYDDYSGDHYTGPLNNGGYLPALSLYHKLTGDRRYREAADRVVDGMAKQAVHRDGYAFYPRGIYGFGEVSDQNAPIPPFPKNAILGWDVRWLVKFYEATGYDPAIKLAGKIARYLPRYGGLLSPEGDWLGARRHTPWNGGCLLGLLKYGLETGDQELVEWCRKSYESRRIAGYGEPLSGWFAEFGEHSGQTGEICAAAFMIELAVKFSSAGVADYWDDVDRWTRNHFAESQLRDCKWMYTVDADQPEKQIDPVKQSADLVGEKNIGNFAGWPAINDFYGDRYRDREEDRDIFMHCCAGEGNVALFRVWKNILHYKDGKLKVNLLMNRASHWADIDSYIPYEGSVDVKMKTKAELSIRIPEWVKPREVSCTVNRADRALSFEGRYAQVGRVKAKDAVTLSFPIFIRTNKVTVQGKEYTLTRKGNEVIHIEPDGKYSPLYQRNKYRENKAQLKTVERFVADRRDLEAITVLY